ncbi:MAG: sulfotransferase family protein [Bacteroidales bacterium]|nr:sulfotransferase family protein [Bacteroidales bacterium]
MVISHKHKYVFVELPRTATSAISNELVENYSGKQILNKHSTYREFLMQATEEEKRYFVFSGVRNPLERIISIYEKLKQDHKGQFSSLKRKNKKTLGDRWLIKQFDFIQNRNACFSEYFLKFHIIPYNDMSCLDHHRFDFIYKYENLKEDFSRLLSKLNIEIKRPLPIINKTKKSQKNLESYYNNDKVIGNAIAKFGPFMREWRYDFPVSWEKKEIGYFDTLNYKLFTSLRIIYYKHIYKS